MYRGRGDHLITAATEHQAVLDACRRLEVTGFRVSFLPVGRDGLVSAGAGRGGDHRPDRSWSA